MGHIIVVFGELDHNSLYGSGAFHFPQLDHIMKFGQFVGNFE